MGQFMDQYHFKKEFQMFFYVVLKTEFKTLLYISSKMLLEIL